MRLRGGFVTVALLAAGAGASFWYARFRPRPVPVVQMAEDVPLRVFRLGTIEARVSARIGFEAAGVLTEGLADRGDCAAPGTPVARVNNASQEARVARTKATLASAEAQQLRVPAVLERMGVIAARHQGAAAAGVGEPGTAPLKRAEQGRPRLPRRRPTCGWRRRCGAGSPCRR